MLQRFTGLITVFIKEDLDFDRGSVAYSDVST